MKRPPLLPPQRKLRAMLALVIVAALTALALVPPHSQGSGSGLESKLGLPEFFGCVFHKMTGLPCPLCGGTRAAAALLHGDIPRALYLNPLAIPAVVTLGICALILTGEAAWGWSSADWPAVGKRASRFFPLIVLLLVLWWIPHVWSALKESKTELIDLRNPVARALYEGFCPNAR